MPVPPRRRSAPADAVESDGPDVHPDDEPIEPRTAPAVDYADVFDSRPSKTRRKKESHDLQDLGQALVEMPDKRLVGLPMDESLLDAIRVYRHTRSFEGRRRQMQYIGKLMRRADPEPLREAVAAMQLGRAQDSLALHQAEHWRVVLIADDEAIDRWLAEVPRQRPAAAAQPGARGAQGCRGRARATQRQGLPRAVQVHPSAPAQRCRRRTCRRHARGRGQR